MVKGKYDRLFSEHARYFDAIAEARRKLCERGMGEDAVEILLRKSHWFGFMQIGVILNKMRKLELKYDELQSYCPRYEDLKRPRVELISRRTCIS